MNELREEKKKLENEILKLINNFENTIGCYVYEVDLMHYDIRTTSGNSYMTKKVEINFKL